MENNKSWFESAKDALEEEINESGTVDGVGFLSGYLQSHWPIDLDESVDDEQFEAYVSESIDCFEDWLKSSNSGIEVQDNYAWGTVESVLQSERDGGSTALTEAQDSLLQQAFETLEKSDFAELSNIRNLLIKMPMLTGASKAALMAAKLGDKHTDIGGSKRAEAWAELAKLSKELDDSKNACRYYEEAGGIVFIEDPSMAAQYYEQSANNSADDNWEKKHQLLRTARVLYANAGLNDDASKLYIQESNLKVENGESWDKFYGRCYCVLSNYGESPWRVFGWMLGVIAFCALIYWCVDINTPGAGVYKCSHSTEQGNFICNELEAERAHPFTHLYFSAVTFTTLGYGDFSPAAGAARVVAAIQAFLGLMLSSLFIATFLRKFSR